jgi:hypothetical protein
MIVIPIHNLCSQGRATLPEYPLIAPNRNRRRKMRDPIGEAWKMRESAERNEKNDRNCNLRGVLA